MGGFVGIEVAAESGATGRWPVGRYPPMRPGPPDAGGARLGGNAETERVTITIANPRVVNSKSLYALVDVEVQVAGLSFVIVGVQVRRGSAGLSARLPTHRDVNGAWRPVVEMPEELLRPLGNAVMEFLVEEGLAERRSANIKL